MNEPTLFFFVSFFMLVIIRNAVVFYVDVRAIRVAREKTTTLIHAGESDFLSPFRRIDSTLTSHLKKLLDLRKWTYKQFYPDWE